MHYDVKKMRSVVHDRKTNYKYLTSYLGWKNKEHLKAERLAKSVDKKLSELDLVNEKGLDQMVEVKDELDNYIQKYKKKFEKFVAQSDAEALAMSAQKHKLGDILGEGHYIDSYSIVKELLRKHILVSCVLPRTTKSG